jgi:HSP20 family protein
MTKEKREENVDRKAIRRWGEEPFEVTRRLDRVFQRFMDEFEDTFRTFPSMRWRPVFPEARVPLCDVVDLGDRYSITMEIPGIEKEKIDISVDSNTVEVKAETRAEEEEKGKNYIYRERKHKTFHRHIDLPEEVMSSKAEAKMRNGELEIIVPKKSPKLEEKAVKLEIK